MPSSQRDPANLPTPSGPSSKGRHLILQAAPSVIAAQSARQPEATALAMGCTTVSYGEMERRATQLAHYLRSLGAGPETVVGVNIERSPEFVIAALAIMKCGAAYLPMDAAYPADRLRYILADASVRLLVTRQELVGRFGDSGVRTVAIDAEKASISEQPIGPLGVEPKLDTLAYVIYTSGSTGRPKGVEVTHRNLSNLIAWHVGAFGLLASDRATLQSGVGFDAAVWELWPCLTIGASVHVPDDATRMSACSLRDWIVARQITISFAPTALAEQMIALPWPKDCALKHLLTGADTLQRYPCAGLPFSLVNNYGPTECTVVATSAVIAPKKAGDGRPPIGFPIDNVQVRILDEQLREVPSGVSGEIYIGGAGVARGYRNRSELTAERFIADPSGANGARLYRTGDLGRSLSDGQIEFLGRVDDQVKIRGYRIELNEINAVLNELPWIQSSLVIVREDAPGDKRLVAYGTPAAGCQPDEKSAREAIRRRLPDYMEPTAYVWMPSLPLTPNGKIDRSKLPQPAVVKEIIAPRTPVEESVAKIMTHVLGMSDLSVEDDFFTLGGHSLLGAQLVAEIRGVFGVDLRLRDIFEAPTVAELSEKIEETLAERIGSMTDEEVSAALAGLATAQGTNTNES